MKYTLKSSLFKFVIINGINNINCSDICNCNQNNKNNDNLNNNNNNNNDDNNDENNLKTKRDELLVILKVFKKANEKYGNIFDIDITEDNIKNSVYYCSNPDINIEIIEDKFDKLKKIFEDEKLCAKKKELVDLLINLEQKNNKLENSLKISLDINKDKIIDCEKEKIDDLKNKLDKYKERIEFISKISDSTYKIIEKTYSTVGNIRFKIVLKEDNYIYLYHNFNEFAKSVNEFKGDFKVENINKIKFIIKNKTDELTFEEIIKNIGDNIANKCPLYDIFKDTYFLTLKFTDKDSKEIYYKYNVSTNRDLITNEKGYWFNFKDGKLGKYFYDPKTKQMGYQDGDYGFLGSESVRRSANCYNQFLEGN